MLEQEIPYSQIPNYGYFTVPVNKWLHKNAVYRYSLKNVDIEDNLPKGVYTVTEEMHAAPNCGLSLNSAGLEGEALTRFSLEGASELQKCIILLGLFWRCGLYTV